LATLRRAEALVIEAIESLNPENVTGEALRYGDGLLPERPVTASAKSRFSARRITALREKLGLTKAALARQIGVNVNTLWRWEETGSRTGYTGS
jgi:hypothetical protein